MWVCSLLITAPWASSSLCHPAERRREQTPSKGVPGRQGWGGRGGSAPLRLGQDGPHPTQLLCAGSGPPQTSALSPARMSSCGREDGPERMLQEGIRCGARFRVKLLFLQNGPLLLCSSLTVALGDRAGISPHVEQRKETAGGVARGTSRHRSWRT